MPEFCLLGQDSSFSYRDFYIAAGRYVDAESGSYAWAPLSLFRSLSPAKSSHLDRGSLFTVNNHEH